MAAFRDRLAAGHFVITGELSPPRDGEDSAFRRELAAHRGVLDAVNLTDNPGASVRACALAGAAIAVAEGLHPILQVTCRDRNRIALQSDLLGAWLLGVRTVMAMTGDPPSVGDHPDAKPVFDLDSFGLIRAIRDLRERGVLLSGKSVAHAPAFLIGGAEAPFAGPAEKTVARLAQKAEAGVDFVQTQFIFDVPRFAEWLAQTRAHPVARSVKVIAGVGLFRSAAAARHLQQSIPGSGVPDWLIAALDQPDPARAEAAGLELAANLITELRDVPGLAGVHCMPIRWPGGVPKVIAATGLRQPQAI